MSKTNNEFSQLITDVTDIPNEQRDRAQQFFVKKVNELVEDQIDALNTDDDLDIEVVRDAIRGTASDIIGLIEGEDNKRNPGYFLIPKGMKMADVSLTNNSISDGLSALFENINN